MKGKCGHELPAGRRAWCSDECQALGARDRLQQLRYNITLDEQRRILAAQGGVCPICERAPRDGESFVTDHDHKSGLVRGVVCTFDNLTFLGRHSQARKFRNAADYLENPPAFAVVGERIAAPTKRRRKNAKGKVGTQTRRRSRVQ